MKSAYLKVRINNVQEWFRISYYDCEQLNVPWSRGYWILLLLSVGCRGVECNKTFDLIKDDCQISNPDTGNTVPTLYPGMEPTDSIDRICPIEDLIRAIRIQSVLGALVGLLSFTLVVVIIGWVRTYSWWEGGEKWDEIYTKSGEKPRLWVYKNIHCKCNWYYCEFPIEIVRLTWQIILHMSIILMKMMSVPVVVRHGTTRMNQ